jgi:hypothetical protein
MVLDRVRVSVKMWGLGLVLKVKNALQLIVARIKLF